MFTGIKERLQAQRHHVMCIAPPSTYSKTNVKQFCNPKMRILTWILVKALWTIDNKNKMYTCTWIEICFYCTDIQLCKCFLWLQESFKKWFQSLRVNSTNRHCQLLLTKSPDYGCAHTFSFNCSESLFGDKITSESE